MDGADMASEMSQGARLQALRRARGFKSQREAASSAGMPESTWALYESGARGIGARAATKLGLFFNVPPGDIMFGRAFACILGSVGGDGLVEPLVSSNGLVDGAEVPWIANPSPEHQFKTEAPVHMSKAEAEGLAALRVDTIDLTPLFLPGDVVFYRPDQARYDPAAVHGRRCVVVADTGEVFLRMVSVSGDQVTLLACGSGRAIHLGNRAKAIWPILWVRTPDPVT